MELAFHTPDFFPCHHYSKSLSSTVSNGFKNSSSSEQCLEQQVLCHCHRSNHRVVHYLTLVQSCVLKIRPQEANSILEKADPVSPVGQEPWRGLWFATTTLTHHSILGRSLNKSVFGMRLERWLLYSVYWSINLILSLTNVDLQTLSYVRLFPALP